MHAGVWPRSGWSAVIPSQHSEAEPGATTETSHKRIPVRVIVKANARGGRPGRSWLANSSTPTKRLTSFVTTRLWTVSAYQPGAQHNAGQA